MEPAEDGTAAIDVSMASIHVTSTMSGQVSAVYDSTEPPVEGDEYARSCSPFIANRFTVRVSPKGEVIDPGLDGLFLAAAEKRAKDEDDALRNEFDEKSNQALRPKLEGLSPSEADQLKEMVKKANDQVMEAINARSGSRKDRVLALKEQMEKSSVLGREQVSGLVNRLMAVLPDEAVRIGDVWRGALPPQVDVLPPIAGMYTLQATEQNVCTIWALGQRGLDEDLVIEEEPHIKVTSRLEGSSEGTLQVERPTGWLRHREQKTNLHGVVTTTIVGPQPRDISDQISIEITSTLTTLK